MKCYTTIVLNGISNNSKYLTEYFIREQKLAENEFIDYKEFFERCNDVLIFLVEDLKKQLYVRKNELFLMRSQAENKISNFGDLNGKTYEECCVELIENCNSELNEISIDNFTNHLHSITNGKFWGHLSKNEIDIIDLNLNKAKQSILKPKIEILESKILNNLSTNQPQQPQPTDTKNQSKDYKKEYWFIVGLSFATGKMDLLLKQYNRNFTQIAKDHFKNDNYRQYINETANWEQYDTDKNIYKRPKKMLKIHEHCIENNIEMIDFFIQKFNDCEPK